MLQENDKIVVDDKLVANIFNDYFCNIASTIGFDDPITTTHDVINKHRDHPSVLKIRETYSKEADSFSFSCVDANVVTSKLRSIKINKGPGYDCIPGKLIRLAHEVLSPHFTYMLNQCITRSVFPSNMKNAELSPLYKREDQLNKVNYRPVSLLTVISKIYESIMFDQVSDYFDSIFEDLLCAFRKKYSCQSTLIKAIDDWKVSLDRNQMIGTVFMDLSKAFDCLPHGLIIAKLHAYGLSLDACSLFSSYLCNRFQRVKVKTSRSEWAVIKKGIPQGSILGPLLFNVFVNDMFHFMEKCDLYNYADDNSLSVAFCNIHDVLSYLGRDCKNAVKWFRDNGMQANPSKFQFMIISHSPVDTSKAMLQIDDNIVLKPESQVKVLGVTLDNKLNFSHHVSVICTKAARQLNALARISRFLSTTSRMIIYNSFINSNFNYCPLVWHFCGKKNGDKIEKIQERALRIIYRNYDSLYPEVLREARTYTMTDKRLRSMLLHVFKSLKGMNAKCLNDMFSVKQNKYSMRQAVKLVQPRRKTTTVGLKTVSYLGAKLWNDNAVLCNELWNEDFLTFKHIINDSNLDIIIYDEFQYLWKLTSVLLILIRL